MKFTLLNQLKNSVALITILASLSLSAQSETPWVTESTNDLSSQIAVGGTIPFIELGINSTNTTTTNPEAYVLLSIDNNRAPFESYTFDLVLNITPILSDGLPDTNNTYQQTLTVQHKPLANAGNSVDQMYHKIENSYGANLEVVSYTETNASAQQTNVPDNVELRMGFKAIRVTPLNQAPFSTSFTALNNEYSVSWSAITGALSYDVEWTWIDNYGNAVVTNTTEDFKRNSTRINTKETSYKIPSIYDNGVLSSRVRAVGRFNEDYTKQLYGEWSAIQSTTIVGHESNKNWQFQASYAEDGKKKEVVSYFDGTLRNRQTVTKINSDDNAIVGEVIYDNQGRPAIEVLPVPAGDNKLQYYTNFNKNTTGVKYSHLDFDWDEQSDDITICDINVSGMTKTNGASKYYSPNNTSLSEFTNFIPDAELYPFSQIEYTADNTGRIKRKGGVGINHRLGTNHEMKYLYSKPLQPELDRLFGYNVGYDVHYKKNAVIDPNGQPSVSYIDPQGRTIATALVSDNPTENGTDILSGLEDEEDDSLHNFTTQNLISPGTNTVFNTGEFIGFSIDDALRFTTNKMVLKSDLHTFNYNLNITGAFADTCMLSNAAIFEGKGYPFAFDLSLNATNDCGNPLSANLPIDNRYENTNQFNPATYLAGDYVSLIDLNSTVDSSIDFAVVPPIGDMGIYKLLKIDKEALEIFTEDYIKRVQESGCILEASAFDAAAAISGCFTTCQDCVDSIAVDQAAYVNTQMAEYAFLNLAPDDDTYIALNNRFIREYNLLVEACMANCQTDGISTTQEEAVNSISCNVVTLTLVNDMKLFGQYGFQITTQETTETPVLVPSGTSIYSEDNLLTTPFIQDLYANGGSITTTQFSWKTPFHPEHLDDPYHYYDLNGNIIEIAVPITYNSSSNAYESSYPLEVGVVLMEDELNAGYANIEPHELLNFEDYKTFFNAIWAESLVVFHPEYSYVHVAKKLCALTTTIHTTLEIDNGAGTTTGNFYVNIDGFANYLESLSFTEAEGLGYLAEGNTNIVDHDPFFSNGLDFLSVSAFLHQTVMLNAVDKYENPSKSMLYMSLMPLVSNSIGVTPDMTFSAGVGTLSLPEQREELWNIYRNTYLGFRDRIKSVVAHTYAINQGTYNGCIGGENSGDPDLGLTSYGWPDLSPSQTGSALCGNNAAIFADKEKRTISEDYLYNSNQSTAQTGQDLEALTDYQSYVQSGQCPMGRDFEAFLSGIITDTNNLSSNPHLGDLASFTGNYLSMDLFEDLGGLPTYDDSNGDGVLEIINQNTGISVNGNTGATSDIWTIKVKVSNPITDLTPITLKLPFAANYNWSDYNSTWVIKEIKNFNYTTYDLTSNPILFNFEMVAKITAPGSDTILKEIVITGTTTARIGECSIDGQDNVAVDGNGNPIGEDLGSGGSLNDEACGDKINFTKDIKSIFNALNDASLMTSSNIVLNTAIGETYSASILPQLFNDPDNLAVWSFNNGQSTIKVNGVTVFNINFNDENFVQILIGLGDGANAFEAVTFGNTTEALVISVSTINGIYTNNAIINTLNYDCCTYVDGIDCGIIDTDGDGTPDLCDDTPCGDIDSDGDGIFDACDTTTDPSCQVIDNKNNFELAFKNLLNSLIANNIFANASNEYIGDYSEFQSPFISEFITNNARGLLDNTNFNIDYTTIEYDSNYMESNIGRTIKIEFNNSYAILLKIDDLLLNSIAQVVEVDILGDSPSSYTASVTYELDDGTIFNDDLTRLFHSKQHTFFGEYVNGYGLNYHCDLDIILNDINSNKSNSVKDINIELIKRSLNVISATFTKENCVTCIPQTITPVAWSETAYNTNFLDYMATVEGYSKPDYYTHEYFSEMNYQYILEGYTYYLETFSANITGGLDTTSPYFMILPQFGATPLNYGYNDYNSVVDAYFNYAWSNTLNRYLMPDDEDYKTWSEFVSYYLLVNPQICPPKPMSSVINFPNGNDTETNCEEFSQSISDAYGADNYAAYIEGLKLEFKKAYTAAALQSVQETFDVTFSDKEYQYTLYYYDQAGNLTQTVPPEGVNRVEFSVIDPNNDQTSIYDEGRAGATNVPLPIHTLQTQYKYNSLNQLIWQKTPDGGETRFAYDALGRIIASQNAKQLADTQYNKLSYTEYDGLGRIVEAGEINNNLNWIYEGGTYYIDDFGKLVHKYSSLVGQENERVNRFNSFLIKAEVTRTHYDDKVLVEAGVFSNDLFTTSNTEFNSRNRVTAVLYYDEILADKSSQFDNGLFYNYDVHGNVKEVVTYITDLKVANCVQTSTNNILDCEVHLKRVHYDYDLISGNVNQVTFQPNKADQFIHQYDYDADNRIVSVKTSKDGYIWEEDATYQYYNHGPLARMELGENKVQGIDYAYTLQGWLKTVNGESLATTQNDMGHDGAETNSNVAKDAFGYSLSYYDGDYKAIGATNNQILKLTNPGTVLAANDKNLYNGNIKRMVTALMDKDEQVLNTQANNYVYDQLNRIVGMSSQAVVDTPANSSLSTTNSYAATYEYDKNGNLEFLTRDMPKDGGLLNIDDFKYHYKTGTNQLLTVQDFSTQTEINSDLKNQLEGLGLEATIPFDELNDDTINYVYDDIGQLIQDKTEGLTISWRVDGKVKEIHKQLGTEDKRIKFSYDGLGNRLGKEVINAGDTNTLKTVYARDAQGNVLGVYDKIGTVDPGNVLVIDSDLALDNATITDDQGSIGAQNTITVAGGTNSYTVNAPDGEVHFIAGESITLLPGFTASSGSMFTAVIGEASQTDIASFKLKEHHIFGSSRLGLQESKITLLSSVTTNPEEENVFKNNSGDKRYELSNHLGNVLSVISDRKLVKAETVTNTTYEILESSTAAVRWEGAEVDGTIPGEEPIVVGAYDFPPGEIKISFDYDNQSGDTVLFAVSSDQDATNAATNLVQFGVNATNNTASFTTVDYEVLHLLFYTAEGAPFQGVINNFKIEREIESGGTTEEIVTFVPDVLSYNDYYPFGMLLPNRHGSSDSYRYGFNGKEKDDEVKGEGLQYDYGFRIYDPRIGKFLSTDPLMKEYSFYTPYQFAGNSPIFAIDLDGLELKISNTVISCEQVSNKKSKLTITFDTNVHFKVLNTTGVKLEGFEKVTNQASEAISKSFSDKSGLAVLTMATDFEGNQTDVHTYEARGSGNKFTSSYQMISSLDEINDNDYVIVITDQSLVASKGEIGRIAPAYTHLEGNAMIVDISSYKAKKNRITGNYDFNGGGKVVKQIGNTISHEWGHNLGLDDKYEELANGFTKPLKGYETNRMGNSSYSNINRPQIDKVISTLLNFLAYDENFSKQRNENYNNHPTDKSAKESTQTLLDDNDIKEPKQ